MQSLLLIIMFILSMLDKALMVGIIPDAILDVKGEIRPIPLIRTKKQIDQMARGKILKVVANTPEATRNIDAWTIKSDGRILGVENQGNTFTSYHLSKKELKRKRKP